MIALGAVTLWVLDKRNAKRRHDDALKAEVASHDKQPERLARAAADADFFQKTGRLP